MIHTSPEHIGFSTERLDKLGAAMQQMVDRGAFAGISLAVNRHGDTAYARTFGVKDIATGDPLHGDAIFRIASMTKPVTGVALLLLYEAGLWQLDDPVAEFLPEFAKLRVLDPSGRLVRPEHAMTMRELITNTGGISGDAGVAGQFANGPGTEVKRLYLEAGMADGTLADMVSKIAQIPLATQPGTQFQYGLSQDVQGRIVEVLSGQNLAEFFQRRIFEPLGMGDSGFAVPADKAARKAAMATYGPGGALVPARLVPNTHQARVFGPGDAGELPTFLSGGGGLYSTVPDYMRFAQMLLDQGRGEDVTLMAPSSVQLMATNLLPPGVPVEFRQVWRGCGYGVNVGVVVDPGRATLMGGPVGPGTFHWSGAHGTWFWVDPVNDLTGIVHMGAEHPAPDLRALSRSLVYQALTDPGR
jgi:CubicO group peptidase (beta-lactamase class C family)